MSPPWTPDPQLLQSIGRAFPDLLGEPYRVLGSGTDHHTLLVGDATVVRFARSPGAAQRMPVEARLLRWLAPRLPVPVPVPRVHPDIDGVCAYTLLPGEPAMGRVPRRTVGMLLGAFLAVLHHQPLSAVRELGVTSGDDPLGEAWRARGERDLEAAIHAGRVAPAARDTVAALLDRVLVPRERPPRLVHGDLVGEHVLLDAAGSCTGIIDWGDAHVGDPAIDLGGLLYWGGPDLLAAAATRHGPVEAAVAHRATGYAACRAVGDIVHGETHGLPAYVDAGGRALVHLLRLRT